MPELPEVETVVTGIKNHLIHQSIIDVKVYHQKLRHPIQTDLQEKLINTVISSVLRRAKYIIIHSKTDVLIHLGMSGKLLIKDKDYQPRKHDHIIIQLSNGKQLVFNDPRRFGMFYWTESAENQLAHLGIEPLSNTFTAQYLYQKLKPGIIKQRIMDQKLVVGVGNIYACEALYKAKISPLQTQLSLKECSDLVESIKTTLLQAIKAGGTTLKDYRSADDQLGYFQQTLVVYAQDKCPKGHRVLNTKISGRSSYHCPICQVL